MKKHALNIAISIFSFFLSGVTIGYMVGTERKREDMKAFNDECKKRIDALERKFDRTEGFR